MTPAERIGELEAMIEQQREQISGLLERVGEWEGRLAKDSHHRNKPPSSDSLARKAKSLRKPSRKRCSGQLGHRGKTLRLEAAPDAVLEHRLAVCATCCAPLATDVPMVSRMQATTVRFCTFRPAHRCYCPSMLFLLVCLWRTWIRPHARETSGDHDACIDCGTIERPHRASGAASAVTIAGASAINERCGAYPRCPGRKAHYVSDALWLLLLGWPIQSLVCNLLFPACFFALHRRPHGQRAAGVQTPSQRSDLGGSIARVKSPINRRQLGVRR